MKIHPTSNETNTDILLMSSACINLYYRNFEIFLYIYIFVISHTFILQIIHKHINKLYKVNLIDCRCFCLQATETTTVI